MVVKNGDLPIFTMVEIVKQSPTKTNPNDLVIQKSRNFSIWFFRWSHEKNTSGN